MRNRPRPAPSSLLLALTNPHSDGLCGLLPGMTLVMQLFLVMQGL